MFVLNDYMYGKAPQNKSEHVPFKILNKFLFSSPLCVLTFKRHLDPSYTTFLCPILIIRSWS